MTTNETSVFNFEEFLKTDQFASFYTMNIHRTIIYRTMGSLSAIASVSIIAHILRSHYGLSTTYHRLIFGLSIGDVLVSFFGLVLDTTMAPKELNYVVPFAMGNQATCDAQGFLHVLGSGIGLSYNISICFYYLSIVTFNKKDDYIRQKLEPWLHGLSIVVSLFRTSAPLVVNGYNSIGGFCWFTPSSIRLPHCRGLESGVVRDGFTIPCGRGDGKEHPMLRRSFYYFVFGYVFAPPVVIVVTMTLMYRSVQQVEKKMKKYGVGALRLRKKARKTLVVSNNMNATDESGSPCDDTSGGHKRFVQWLKIKLEKLPCTNSVKSQKRVILYRAAGYVGAWAVSWVPFFLWILTNIFPTAMFYFSAFLFPTQGVFNFIAFMYPKIKRVKLGPKRRRGARNNVDADKISWCQAFVKAYMSKGERRRIGSHRTHTNTSIGNSSAGKVIKTVSDYFSTTFRYTKKSSNVHDNANGLEANEEFPPVTLQNNSNICSPLVLSKEDDD